MEVKCSTGATGTEQTTVHGEGHGHGHRRQRRRPQASVGSAVSSTGTIVRNSRKKSFFRRTTPLQPKGKSMKPEHCPGCAWLCPDARTGPHNALDIAAISSRNWAARAARAAHIRFKEHASTLQAGLRLSLR